MKLARRRYKDRLNWELKRYRNRRAALRGAMCASIAFAGWAQVFAIQCTRTANAFDTLRKSLAVASTVLRTAESLRKVPEVIR